MRRAEEVAKEIPFLRSYKGYPGLLICLEIVAKDEEKLVGIRKNVYEPAAKQRGEKLDNFEKNLRTLRDAFIKYGGREYLERTLGENVHMPMYPRELIESLLECMQREN